jgi:hypothetical protein
MIFVTGDCKSDPPKIAPRLAQTRIAGIQDQKNSGAREPLRCAAGQIRPGNER